MLARAGLRQPGASFADARGWFTRANKLDPEDPEPLLMFFQAYRAEKIRPTANAIAALHYAADLAPQDLAAAPAPMPANICSTASRRRRARPWSRWLTTRIRPSSARRRGG